ncbi:nucleotidyltransferase domain-containing protein [Phycicoccus flavus]|uniref:Nucleotidyltransferase domain-containing protein n=1 Tax=Phycicoccus flavus TaxID=2502783 RepID=A0A8T6R6F3_9MICO|nr:nucleotidyltransferase domain-containing protein [Phycicoccus flavus]NHA68405.1 nucleotidyltransferase domain-containing protein [Phycicoccus flavus]
MSAGRAVPPRLAPLLERLVDAAREDPRVTAAWLGGSLARGTADDWSDIDLHLGVEDLGAFDAAAWLGAVTPLVLADPIPGVPHSLVAVTPDWVHVDVVAHEADALPDPARPVRVLLDRTGGLADTVGEPVGFGEPTFPDDDVRLFFYVLGASVAAVRREETQPLAHGAAAMRDQLLVRIMLAENGVRKSDGARRMRRYLTDEQVDALCALPPVGVDPTARPDVLAAVAREYLVRARRLAVRTGAEWPHALEAATLRLWAEELGVDLGAGHPGVDGGRTSDAPTRRAGTHEGR